MSLHLSNLKLTGRFCHIFVAFSEYMNFFVTIEMIKPHCVRPNPFVPYKMKHVQEIHKFYQITKSFKLMKGRAVFFMRVEVPL